MTNTICFYRGEGGSIFLLGVIIPHVRCSRTASPPVRMSACMSISHNDHKNNIHVYPVTVMTHAIALKGGQSGQRTV